MSEKNNSIRIILVLGIVGWLITNTLNFEENIIAVFLASNLEFCQLIILKPHYFLPSVKPQNSPVGLITKSMYMLLSNGYNCTGLGTVETNNK